MDIDDAIWRVVASSDPRLAARVDALLRTAERIVAKPDRGQRADGKAGDERASVNAGLSCGLTLLAPSATLPKDFLAPRFTSSDRARFDTFADLITGAAAQALGMRVPADVHTRSPRLYRGLGDLVLRRQFEAGAR